LVGLRIKTVTKGKKMEKLIKIYTEKNGALYSSLTGILYGYIELRREKDLIISRCDGMKIIKKIQVK
jgi:hypothetical protein